MPKFGNFKKNCSKFVLKGNSGCTTVFQFDFLYLHVLSEYVGLNTDGHNYLHGN